MDAVGWCGVEAWEGTKTLSRAFPGLDLVDSQGHITPRAPPAFHWLRPPAKQGTGHRSSSWLDGLGRDGCASSSLASSAHRMACVMATRQLTHSFISSPACFPRPRALVTSLPPTGSPQESKSPKTAAGYARRSPAQDPPRSLHQRRPLPTIRRDSRARHFSLHPVPVALQWWEDSRDGV